MGVGGPKATAAMRRVPDFKPIEARLYDSRQQRYRGRPHCQTDRLIYYTLYQVFPRFGHK